MLSFSHLHAPLFIHTVVRLVLRQSYGLVYDTLERDLTAGHDSVTGSHHYFGLGVVC